MIFYEDSQMEENFEKAAKAIHESKVLIIIAGAAMGIDSGIPDFRGPTGFWQDYPPLNENKLTITEIFVPQLLDKDPEFGWYLFANFQNIFQNSAPHKGFQILLEWGKKKKDNYFVFTTNVDGHFQRAGFPEETIIEWNGDVKYLQAKDPTLCDELWELPEDFHFERDSNTLKVKPPFPKGPPSWPPETQLEARPHVLLWGDFTWIKAPRNRQKERLRTFFTDKILSTKDAYVIIEIGITLSGYIDLNFYTL